MAQVLLYNIRESDKLVKIKLALYRLGIPCREVPPEDFARPIASLLNEETHPSPPGAPEAFSEEMLLMDGLSGPTFSAFLDELRTVGASVALKAVVTEQNAVWSSHRLCRELQREQQSLQRLSAQRRGKKSAHRKKR